MTKRIFIALDISEEARRIIVDYAEGLRAAFPGLRIGWERAEKIHLTLKFLGETSEEQLEELKQSVERISNKFSKFNLQIVGNGVFPARRNARILWLGLRNETGNLEKLNEELENECAEIGFERERRAFKPHLTIARLREPQKAGELIDKHLSNKIEPVEFEVSEIVVYESRLQPTGSIYDAVKKAKLNAK